MNTTSYGPLPSTMSPEEAAVVQKALRLLDSPAAPGSTTTILEAIGEAITAVDRQMDDMQSATLAYSYDALEKLAVIFRFVHVRDSAGNPAVTP